ncbi:MAG: VanZ family protein, partial [Steroidobacteraceae bacterium]
DTAHAPIFGCLAVLSLFLVRSQQRLRSGSIPRQYLAALALTTLLGVATEVAQVATGRNASFADIGRDVLGAIAFLVLYAGFVDQIRHAANVRRVRSIGIVSAVLLFVILGTPLARAALEYRAREQRFPVLADFSRQFDPYFFGHNRAEVELRRMPQRWATSGHETTLRVHFASEPYPGIEIAEPAPDWRTHSALALDITNPTDAELRVMLWVSDARHDYEYADRLNKPMRIPPHTRSVVRVPLAEVENAPAARRMDLARIATVALFRGEPEDGTEMYLSRVWLE